MLGCFCVVLNSLVLIYFVVWFYSGILNYFDIIYIVIFKEKYLCLFVIWCCVMCYVFWNCLVCLIFLMFVWFKFVMVIWGIWNFCKCCVKMRLFVVSLLFWYDDYVVLSLKFKLFLKILILLLIWNCLVWCCVIWLCCVGWMLVNWLFFMVWLVLEKFM